MSDRARLVAALPRGPRQPVTTTPARPAGSGSVAGIYQLLDHVPLAVMAEALR